jgi:signal transduction histidine kinase/ligand-binding sensor domain-containing protein/CheY-like chemotaxis protein
MKIKLVERNYNRFSTGENCYSHYYKGLLKRMVLPEWNIILLTLLFCLYSPLTAGEKLLPVYGFWKINNVSWQLQIEDQSREMIQSRVVRDNHGFIWIGTLFGLIRYDSYSVYAYRHNPNDPYSLSSNGIQSLFLDSKNRLWVGTYVTGLSLYDVTNDRFINFLPNKGDSLGLRSKRINGIMEYDSGNIWLATHQGVVQVEIPAVESNNMDSLVHGMRFTTYPLGNPYIKTHNLIQQNDHTFLITSDSGLVVLDHTANKTYRLPFTHQLDHTRLSFILKDSRGNFWVGAESGEGLFRIDQEAKKLWNYRYKIDNNTSLKSDIIFGLAEDNDGNIWVCSREGVHLFSPQSGRYLSYLTNDEVLTKEAEFSRISVDNNGVIWISIFGGGVHILDPNYQRFSSYSLRKGDGSSPITFNAVDHDHNGNFWFFSEKGILYQIDINKLEVIKSIDVFKGKMPLKADHYTSFIDAGGTYWHGTYGLGLFRIDLSSGIVKNYGLKAGLHQDLFVNGIAQGLGDTLWMATYLGGLKKFDPVSEKFISVPGLSSRAWEVMRDHTGKVWISTGNDGIVILDPVSGKKEYLRHDPSDPNSLSSDNVLSTYEDATGRIWVQSKNVIDLWDPASRSFIHYPEPEFSTNNYVEPIGYDRKGRLWVRRTGTGLILSFINPATGDYTSFSSNEGIGGLDMESLPDGRVIFVGIRGINIFNPDSIRFNRPAPALVLTRLAINNKPVPSPHLFKKLQLSYTQNMLEFEFAAIDINEPRMIRYKYQLAGLEENWMDPPKFQEITRYAKYPNLDPGDYVFKIRATPLYGDWEQEISLPISISPPWWETKIAYTFYVVLIVLTVFVIWLFQTNRLKMKQQLQMEHFEAEKLREVDQMKSRFFANISHEFRTPLTLIKGPVKQILDGEFAGNLKEQCKMILRNSNRLLELINQILDLSKLESGEIKLQVAETDIIQYLKELVLTFSPLADRKKVTLKFTSTENILTGYVDRDKMEKIVTNLLSNAFKFTPEGGKIEVRISPTPPSIPPLTKGGKTGGVDISISNTSPAIPPDQLDKIFDRFYQADDKYKKDPAPLDSMSEVTQTVKDQIYPTGQEGTGIGLALTKELVEVHHGEINVESEVNKGTTFTVWLPIEKERFKPEEIVEEVETADRRLATGKEMLPLIRSTEDARYTTQDSEVKSETSDRSTVSRLRSPLLLIVEDNPDVTSYISSFMKNDYRIFTAENGKEGFKKALDKYPDLIISDVMMPEMDGFELCKRIKTDERTSHIPIILLTAKADMDSKIEGLEFGCDDYISKPFDARELHARVNNLIEQRKILREKFAQTIEIRPGEIAASSMDEHF